MVGEIQFMPCPHGAGDKVIVLHQKDDGIYGKCQIVSEFYRKGVIYIPAYDKYADPVERFFKAGWHDNQNTIIMEDDLEKIVRLLATNQTENDLNLSNRLAYWANILFNALKGYGCPSPKFDSQWLNPGIFLWNWMREVRSCRFNDRNYVKL